MPAQRLVERLQTEVGLQRDGQTPSEYVAAEPIPLR
jgi:hypothetical protein